MKSKCVECNEINCVMYQKNLSNEYLLMEEPDKELGRFEKQLSIVLGSLCSVFFLLSYIEPIFPRKNH